MGDHIWGRTKGVSAPKVKCERAKADGRTTNEGDPFDRRSSERGKNGHFPRQILREEEMGVKDLSASLSGGRTDGRTDGGVKSEETDSSFPVFHFFFFPLQMETSLV